MMGWLLWLLGGLLLLWGVGAYNRLMRLRNAIGSAWAQLEAALLDLAGQGHKLVEAGSRWLPQEGRALDTLRQQCADLQAATEAVKPRPHQADPVARLAVTHALQAAALQRVQALLEHHPPEEEAECAALLAALERARQQREFGKQLFNQRVALYNQALDELPTRVLAGVYGFHDAGKF